MNAKAIVNKLLEGPDDLEPERYLKELPPAFNAEEVLERIQRECAFCMDSARDREMFIDWLHANANLFPDPVKAIAVIQNNRSWCTDSTSDMDDFFVALGLPAGSGEVEPVQETGEADTEPEAPAHCMCDESHQISDTVCDWCRYQGRVHFNDPAP